MSRRCPSGASTVAMYIPSGEISGELKKPLSSSVASVPSGRTFQIPRFAGFDDQCNTHFPSGVIIGFSASTPS